MPNRALIVASGTGNRMGQDIPKQFLNVYDKPVVIYTLEAFQRHPLVDSITVVCLDGWQQVLDAYAKQFGITKMEQVVTGGKTVQESIRNGVFSLEGQAADDDIIVVHDGIRPLVDDAVLSDVIQTAAVHGNAVSSMPYNEQIFIVEGTDSTTTGRYIPRDTVRRVCTPQAYRFSMLLDAYRTAFSEGRGISPSSYANTLMADLGHTLHLASGSDRNIKLTTTDDLELFKAYIGTAKDTWLK